MIYEWIIATTEDNSTAIRTIYGTNSADVCRKAYEIYKYSTNTDLAEAPPSNKLAKTYEDFKNSTHHEIYYADTEYSDHVVFIFHSIKEVTE